MIRITIHQPKYETAGAAVEILLHRADRPKIAHHRGGFQKPEPAAADLPPSGTGRRYLRVEDFRRAMKTTPAHPSGIEVQRLHSQQRVFLVLKKETIGKRAIPIKDDAIQNQDFGSHRRDPGDGLVKHPSLQ